MKKKMLPTVIFFLGTCFVFWRFLFHSIDKKINLWVLTSISGKEMLSFRCETICIATLLAYLLVKVGLGSYRVYKKTKMPGHMYFLEIISIILISAVWAGIKVEIPQVFSAMMDNGILVLKYSYNYLLIPLVSCLMAIHALRLIKILKKKRGKI